MPRHQKACKVILIIAFVIFILVTIFNVYNVYSGYASAIDAKNNPPENGVNLVGIEISLILVIILVGSFFGYGLSTILCTVNLILLSKDRDDLERKPFLKGILFNTLIVVGGIAITTLSIFLLSKINNFV